MVLIMVCDLEQTIFVCMNTKRFPKRLANWGLFNDMLFLIQALNASIIQAYINAL